MNVDQRIAQFEQMTTADPDNELGHFSLGGAYKEAGRIDDAAKSLTRVIEINPGMSKAYQLLGEALQEAGRHSEAIDVLTRGVTVADEQGDYRPRDAMADSLGKLGASIPAMTGPANPPAIETTAAATASDFKCCRCGRPNAALPKAPFKGELGVKVFDNVCAGCWQEWIGMGTKVINELSLSLSTQAGQDAYDQYMTEFLQLDEL